MTAIKVKTDGDSFASMEHERVLVELTKDGDSPNCPRSWTWGLWFDGSYIDGSIDESSLASSVEDAMGNISKIIRELSAVRDYLMAYGAFGKEPEMEASE